MYISLSTTLLVILLCLIIYNIIDDHCTPNQCSLNQCNINDYNRLQEEFIIGTPTTSRQVKKKLTSTMDEYTGSAGDRDDGLISILLGKNEEFNKDYDIPENKSVIDEDIWKQFRKDIYNIQQLHYIWDRTEKGRVEYAKWREKAGEPYEEFLYIMNNKTRDIVVPEYESFDKLKELFKKRYPPATRSKKDQELLDAKRTRTGNLMNRYILMDKISMPPHGLSNSWGREKTQAPIHRILVKDKENGNINWSNIYREYSAFIWLGASLQDEHKKDKNIGKSCFIDFYDLFITKLCTITTVESEKINTLRDINGVSVNDWNTITKPSRERCGGDGCFSNACCTRSSNNIRCGRVSKPSDIGYSDIDCNVGSINSATWSYNMNSNEYEMVGSNGHPLSDSLNYYKQEGWGSSFDPIFGADIGCYDLNKSIVDKLSIYRPVDELIPPGSRRNESDHNINTSKLLDKKYVKEQYQCINQADSTCYKKPTPLIKDEQTGELIPGWNDPSNRELNNDEPIEYSDPFKSCLVVDNNILLCGSVLQKYNLKENKCKLINNKGGCSDYEITSEKECVDKGNKWTDPDDSIMIPFEGCSIDDIQSHIYSIMHIKTEIIERILVGYMLYEYNKWQEEVALHLIKKPEKKANIGDISWSVITEGFSSPTSWLYIIDGIGSEGGNSGLSYHRFLTKIREVKFDMIFEKAIGKRLYNLYNKGSQPKIDSALQESGFGQRVVSPKVSEMGEMISELMGKTVVGIPDTLREKEKKQAKLHGAAKSGALVATGIAATAATGGTLAIAAGIGALGLKIASHVNKSRSEINKFYDKIAMMGPRVESSNIDMLQKYKTDERRKYITNALTGIFLDSTTFGLSPIDVPEGASEVLSGDISKMNQDLMQTDGRSFIDWSTELMVTKADKTTTAIDMGADVSLQSTAEYLTEYISNISEDLKPINIIPFLPPKLKWNQYGKIDTDYACDEMCADESLYPCLDGEIEEDCGDKYLEWDNLSAEEKEIEAKGCHINKHDYSELLCKSINCAYTCNY